jgi:hypothetical protein
MDETQPAGVQELSIGHGEQLGGELPVPALDPAQMAVPPAILGVTEYRVARFLQMRSDLVSPPGLQIESKIAQKVEYFNNLV